MCAKEKSMELLDLTQQLLDLVDNNDDIKKIENILKNHKIDLNKIFDCWGVNEYSCFFFF